jgi:2'-aminobiphenyl-2,3-diol 1,2-dioxygenase, large subunit
MMGKIVSVVATSHILMSPAGIEDRARHVVNGIKEIGRRVRAANPDVLVVISSDHMFNLNLALQPPFCVGVSDTFVPFGDMDIAQLPRRGSRGFAQALVERAALSGFDVAKAEEFRPDHGIALPLMLIDPDRVLPIVPLLVNINMDPAPTPSRCYALGTALREAIESDRPEDERVAIVATGGLSHWLNIPRHGEVSEQFDRQVMNAIITGHAPEFARMSTAEIVEQGGNGGLEIVNWLIAAATVPGRNGEIVYYEPIPEWFTGMGGIVLAAA